MTGSEDYSAAEAEPMDPNTQRNKKRKRRFSEDQVRSLESTFESRANLDVGKKLELAGELGLQPRQVSIWFQNRRARWKSKQLESEYGALRAEYDALLSSFDLLKKENQILTQQLQMLGEQLVEPLDERSKAGDRNNGGKEEQRPIPLAAERSELRVELHSDDIEKFISKSSDEEAELYDGRSSAEQQFCLQTSWPSFELSDGLQWWEFWPTE